MRPDVNALAITSALHEAKHKIELAMEWVQTGPSIPEEQWPGVARAAQDLHRALTDFERRLQGGP